MEGQSPEVTLKAIPLLSFYFSQGTLLWGVPQILKRALQGSAPSAHDENLLVNV